MLKRRMKRQKVDKTFDHIDWYSGYNPADEAIEAVDVPIEKLLSGEALPDDVRSDVEAIVEAAENGKS